MSLGRVLYGLVRPGAAAIEPVGEFLPADSTARSRDRALDAGFLHK